MALGQQSPQPAQKLVSLVVPMYCEAAGVEAFLTEVIRQIAPLAYRFEIIAVDDGSTDTTLNQLENWVKREPRLCVLSLSRNYGHQMALLAGLDQAQGDAVITLDADLQHPPSYIPEMLRQWADGYDVVQMMKLTTAKRGHLKTFLADVFYKMFNRISSVKIHANASDFRLVDRKVLDVIREYRQRQFFLRGIVSEVGFRSTSLEYHAPARLHGEARYTLAKLMDLALRGLFSYSNLALKIPLYLGILLTLLSCLNILWALIKLALGNPPPAGWLSTFSLITALFSLVFLFLGFQGVYIARIYDEVRKQPLYSLKAKINAK